MFFDNRRKKKKGKSVRRKLISRLVTTGGLGISSRSASTLTGIIDSFGFG